MVGVVRMVVGEAMVEGTTGEWGCRWGGGLWEWGGLAILVGQRKHLPTLY